MPRKYLAAGLLAAVLFLAWKQRAKLAALVAPPKDAAARLLDKQYKEGWGYGD